MAWLALFSCLCFAALFLFAAGVRLLALRFGLAAGFPGLGDPASAGRWALPLALYAGVLLSMTHAARRRVFAPLAMLCVFAVAVAFSAVAARALDGIPPAAGGTAAGARIAAEPGLILANRAHADGTAIVLLQGTDGSGDLSEGARVLAVPGSPLVFLPQPAGVPSLLTEGPPAHFGDGAPRFLRNAAADIRLASGNLMRLFAAGANPFLLYVCALAFLLTSLMTVLRFGAWPMTGFFLGAVAFRGVLALETHLNSAAMGETFATFLGGRVDPAFAVPGVFIAAGLLLHLYSLLLRISKIPKKQARHGTS